LNKKNEPSIGSTLLSTVVSTRMGLVITMPSPVLTLSQLQVLMKLNAVKCSEVACYIYMENQPQMVDDVMEDAKICEHYNQ
jgi:hypothetical protein